MLGKLFGFGKKTPPTTPAPVAPAEKPEKTSIAKKTEPRWQALAGVQSIDEIGDADTLQQLLKHSAQLDKKTNRQIRERLQAIKTLENRNQQAHALQEKICSRLETLSRLQHHPLFDSEFTHLQQQWRSINTPDAALAARTDAAIARCLAIQSAAATLKQQQQALEQQQAEIAEAAAQERLRREAEIVQQQAEHAALQLTAREQKKEQKKQQQDREKSRRTEQTQQAEKLQQQRKQHELQDWQAFAAIPKLEALCDAMETLCNSTLPPLETADAVRELQAQWRGMKAPHRKETQILWKRFRQASDKAWEPCAVHYEKERQRRAFNLQQREVICDALEQFVNAQDWARADWKAVAQILEKSRREFHDFHPVERTAEKPVRARFDAVFATINRKLLDEQVANEARKQQLVNAAQSISGMGDVEKAAERFIQLQEQWKQIGITRHHEDHKLWQALQEHGKTVFEKRRAGQQQQRQEQDSKIEQARNICARIAGLATLDDSALAQSTATFEQLQAEYKTITGIPEKLQGAIKKQFAAACDAYRQQMAGLGERQRKWQMDELVRRAQLCTLLEQQPSAATAEHVASVWQQHSLPADWDRAINQRKQRALSALQGDAPLDHSANEQQLRELCIALEILLDLETPETDRQQRRDYQLRKLQQGMGQAASGNRQATLEQLLVDWYCTGSATAGIQENLQARFDAALSRNRQNRQ